jgi:hypothetical protein
MKPSLVKRKLNIRSPFDKSYLLAHAGRLEEHVCWDKPASNCSPFIQVLQDFCIEKEIPFRGMKREEFNGLCSWLGVDLKLYQWESLAYKVPLLKRKDRHYAKHLVAYRIHKAYLEG